MSPRRVQPPFRRPTLQESRSQKITRRTRQFLWVIIPLIALIIALILTRYIPGFTGETLPDFSQYHSSAEKKEAFFNYLTPRVEEANQEVAANREELLKIETLFTEKGSLRHREKKWTRALAKHYELEIDQTTPIDLSLIQRLKMRVDAIPTSLILAQAALESGWGTSRFARKGNNLFGMRCYSPGCGIVPKRRPPGTHFEVTRFSTPADCFSAYIHNLNTHPAYSDLRRIRSKLRNGNQPLSGIALADGLYRYSSEGWTYVRKIKSLIRASHLEN